MAKWFSVRIQVDYFKFLLGRNKRFIGLMSAAMLLAYPVFVMTLLSLNSYDAPTELFVTGRVFAMVLFVVFSLIVPILMFSYINSKRDLDVYFALPIKREQMLQTTGWAGYVILVIPFMLAWLFGGLITVIYSTISAVLLVESFFTIIMIGSAVYTVVIFTMMNTGTTLDAFLYSIAVHSIPLLVYGAYLLFGYSMLLGFSDLNSVRILNFVSPLWALFNVIFGADLLFPPLAYGLYWVLIALVLSAVSSHLYTTRPSEKADTPFVNKRFFPIVSTTYAVLILILLYNLIYSSNSNPSVLTLQNLIFPLMFAGIVYLVMDVIANRGTRNMVKAMIRYVLVAALTLAVFIPSTITGGFGYVTRIPKAENVKSVELNVAGSAGMFFPTSYLSYSYDNFDGYTPKVQEFLDKLQSQTMVFDQVKDIKTIVDFHKIILKEYKWVDYSTKATPARGFGGIDITAFPKYTPSYQAFPFENTNYGTMNATLTYRMNDGSKLRRTYEISGQWTRNLLSLSSSKQMIKLSAPMIANIDLYESFSGFKLHDALMTTSNTNLSGFDFKVFAQQYLKDVETIAKTGTFLPDATIIAYLEVTGSAKLTPVSSIQTNDRIAIDSRFTNTLTWLQAHAYAIPQPRYTNETAVLVLPKPDTKNIIYYVAGVNSSVYSYSDAEKEITYIRLSPQQLAKIMPYMSVSGFSDTPLPALFAANDISTGDVSNGIPANPTGMRNLLVQKEHVADVLAIIKDNPRETGIGYNFFVKDKLLTGRFVDTTGQAEYIFKGNIAFKYYKGKLYDTCEYYIDASGNHIIIEYRNSTDPNTTTVAVESALWNVDPNGQYFTHNFLGVSSSISFVFNKVADPKP
ncbi:MAG: hypothetical protein WBL80_06760 [Erysipelotrichaceae bacterium]